MRFATTLAVLLFVCAPLPAEVPATQPAATQPGATQATPYKIEPLVRQDPKVRGQIVRIDLTNPDLEIAVAPGGPDPDGAGPWETVLQPTSVIARANAFDLAVNTVFFMVPKSDKPATKLGHIYRSGEFASSTAMLMSQGKLLCAQRGGASIVFDRKNAAYIGKVGAMPPEAHTIVTGDQQIVFRGRNTATTEPTLAPRAALGLTEDRKTMILVVIDGRRLAWSEGVSLVQLADEMIRLGCTNAINLDGGGSATLVQRQDDKYKVINTPSDGSTSPLPLSIERPVPYAMGLRFKAAPTTPPQSDATGTGK